MPSIFTRKKSAPPTAAPVSPAAPPAAVSPSSPQLSAPTPASALPPLSSREGQAQPVVLPRRDSASIDQQRSQQRSPEKKNRSSFVKEREREAKDKRPKSPRSSKSFSTRNISRKNSDSHPLNLPPEELKRLSARSVARMGSPTNSERAESTEPMQESTPAPQSAPGAFPQTNGTNGDHAEDGPAPPPHRTPTSPPPQPTVDAEKCKEAGNKFFKAKQYDKAIEEYTKGWSRASWLAVSS